MTNEPKQLRQIAQQLCTLADALEQGQATSVPAPAPAPAAPPQPPSSASQTRRSGVVIPGGRARNTPIEDAETRDLEYWAGRIEGDLASGTTKPQFVDKDTAIVAAMRRELARRAGGGGAGDSFDDGHQADPSIPFASSSMHLSVHPPAQRWERR